MEHLEILAVHGREILDSRGNPTVEATVTVKNHATGRMFEGTAAVPSGASTGMFEAVELRDGEPRYFGLGVRHAVQNVNEKIAHSLIGKNACNQQEIDDTMLHIDGTENKSNLGANAMLAVSMATAKAASEGLEIPLFKYLGGVPSKQMPRPMMNILNGGKHAENTVDFQEFMIVPMSTDSFSESLRVCAEVYHHLKQILKQRGLSTGVGDEGGFAPDLPDAESVMELMVEAIETAGYMPGRDICISLDVAASELYDEADKRYYFPGESKLKGTEIYRDTLEMINYLEYLTEKFPILSIEDGLSEEDWDGWKLLTDRIGDKVRLVGDDLFVTNTKRIAVGIQKGCGNAVLIKVNQIGTLTESLAAIDMSFRNGFTPVISHRSGETEDTFIADLAVAVSAEYIKMGAPCRAERVAKYNRLLRIEEKISQ